MVENGIQRFEKWSDEQRSFMLLSMVKGCSPKRLQFVKQCIDEHLPVCQEDFTRVLPRVLSLFIFSYLDPRSLCRCSQVCWFWNQLCEMDQLWLPKCVRFGWYLPQLPSPFECSSWKRLYVDKIQSLRLFHTKELVTLDQELEKFNLEKKQKELLKTKKSLAKNGQKPWKRADLHPKDLIRYNYLENNEFYTEGCTEDFYKKISRPNKSASSKQLVNSAYTIRYNLNKKPISKLKQTDELMLNLNTDYNTSRLQTTPAFQNYIDTLQISEEPITTTITLSHSKCVRPVQKNQGTLSNSLFPSQPWKLATDQTDSDS
ncbi:F-box only protein 16 isoform X1 [Octopus bimaculoides]|uniref:F-box only protein 16 isoform X1 n=2 Tax=Octopus bimaculoides TaxID=37653 RepID=UPI0022E16EBF|nr:F-box only protein 16 isoform X1 [Octopus bimaculoides]